MGKVARRFAALVVVASAGCSFDAGGSNDSNQLGSSMGTEATASVGDDTENGTGSGSASADGSTSFVAGSTSVGNDESCVDVCAPTVPQGWNGPFYVVEAANPIDCPTGFARQDLGFSGLTAAPATCTCACGETAGDCRVEYDLSVTSGCAPVVQSSLQNGGCEGYNAFGADIRMEAELVGNPVSCTAAPGIDAPEATWESASTLCAAPARGGDCGADECIAQSPDGYATRMCISGEGRVDCPAGDWSTRTIVFRSFDDKRSCMGCTCSGPTACEGQAFAHDSTACGGVPQDVEFGVCTDISVSALYSVGATVDNGICEASDGMPAGDATPTDAITLCCAG